VLLLWLPFATHATLTRFTAGAFRLAVFEGIPMGVAVFLAVRFGGAPRMVWIGVAVPAILSLAVLPFGYLGRDTAIGSLGLGWYVNGVVVPSVVSTVCALVGSALPRRTPEWSLDD
jgi:hypothetical protein